MTTRYPTGADFLRAKPFLDGCSARCNCSTSRCLPWPGGGSRIPADARPADGGAGGGPERGVHPRGPADRPVEPGAEAVPAAEMAGGARRRDGGDPDPGGGGGRGGRAGESREGGRRRRSRLPPPSTGGNRSTPPGCSRPGSPSRKPGSSPSSGTSCSTRGSRSRPSEKPCRFPTIT